MTVFVSYQQQVLSEWVGAFCACLERGTPVEVQRVLPGTRRADVASNHCSTNYTTESTDLGQTLLGWSLCPSHQLSGWLTAAAESGQRHHVVNTMSSSSLSGFSTCIYGWAVYSRLHRYVVPSFKWIPIRQINFAFPFDSCQKLDSSDLIRQLDLHSPL